MAPATRSRGATKNRGTSAGDVEEGGVASSEQTPLLSSTTTAAKPSVTLRQEEPLLKDMKAESIKEKGVAGIAAVTFGTSLLSLIFQGASNPLVIVSGILGTVLSPLAAMQQAKLTQVEALDQTNDVLEEEVQQLQQENKRLQTQIVSMQESLLNLQTMQQTLSALQGLQGDAVEELETQVQESRDILAKMECNYQTALLQNLITVLLNSDDDGNMLLSDTELDEMIHQMEGINGVDLKEDKLKQIVIQQGRSVAGIMEVIRNLLDDTLTDDENIFTYVDDKDPRKELSKQ